MNCEQARLELGAAPAESSAALAVHLPGCADCRAYQAEMQQLDAQIQRAMQLPLPGPATVHTPAPRRRFATPRVLALAASVLLATVAVLLLWPAQSAPALADELVEHVAHQEELGSWDNTEIVPQGTLDQVLRKSGVHVTTAGLARIVYAHSCFFRGRYVPHLVLRTSQAALTVLPLPGMRIEAEERFIESDFSGVLLPHQGGAIAVLARGRTDVSFAARELRNSIRFEP